MSETQAKPRPLKTEIADQMRIEWDVPIAMDDGNVLRADVFRPVEEGESPVIMSHGPYGKNLSFQAGYPIQWEQMCEEHPDIPAGSTNKYQAWEVVDPEKWVREGYAVVRVDSRGTGRSPGVVDMFSPRETRDYYECIEWAAEMPWSNGKVGLNGISYYAMNQWHVASLQPPHLAAMCVWEGAGDWYRDSTHQGGILNQFWSMWYPNQVLSVQHGLGKNGRRNEFSGIWVSGDTELPEDELEGNHGDLPGEILAHPLDDDYYRERSAVWEKVSVPFLTAANLGGVGNHSRGNYEGWLRAASEDKYLEVHGLEHWTHFYTDYGRELQLRFFDYYLKGVGDWKEAQPKVQINRRWPGNRFEIAGSTDWPLPQTVWTPHHLDAAALTLGTDGPATAAEVTYDAGGDGLGFTTEPFAVETEWSGPLAAKLFISSESEDADIFLVVRMFDPDDNEVVFPGTVDPNTPIARGWLRASHRKLDPVRSESWRPYHTHDEIQKLTPGKIYELDIELWPTGIVVPPGYRMELQVRGRDYEYPPAVAAAAKSASASWLPHQVGCGPFLHEDERDRPAGIFDGRVTVHTGPEHPSHLLVPVVAVGGEPARRS
jgi:predicted acyl esterase